MSYHTRTILPPILSRKRKDRDPLYSSTSTPSTQVNPILSNEAGQESSLSSNRLLAGYMAFEFLTKGTLFGQKFDPTRVETLPVNSVELRRNKPGQHQIVEGEPGEKNNYAEVANLLKSDEAHIAGVVNPTHLARWLQL